MPQVKRCIWRFVIIIISGLHHYECIVSHTPSNLQSGQFWLVLHISFNTIPQTGEGMALAVQRSKEKVLFMRCNRCRDFLTGFPSCRHSAKDNHWNSSLLRPPTDSWGKGHHYLYHSLQPIPVVLHALVSTMIQQVIYRVVQLKRYQLGFWHRSKERFRQ